jgi:hypothetical protein
MKLSIAAPQVTKKVFFDMTQGDTKLGRIVIGLYGDVRNDWQHPLIFLFIFVLSI